jgi:hypothetical protein
VAVSERDRHRLSERLIEQLGEEAAVLMELLPRTDWSDLATKGDLRELRTEVTAEVARASASFHRDMVRQTWVFVAAMFAGLGALSGLLH